MDQQTSLSSPAAEAQANVPPATPATQQVPKSGQDQEPLDVLLEDAPPLLGPIATVLALATFFYFLF